MSYCYDIGTLSRIEGEVDVNHQLERSNEGFFPMFSFISLFLDVIMGSCNMRD